MALFFFQAEDGIRDVAVTGVQTCALPISAAERRSIPNSSSPEFRHSVTPSEKAINMSPGFSRTLDRKSTRLNSSHGYISYAVFCLKKKKKKISKNIVVYIIHLSRAYVIYC